jgi:ABC-type Fe3+-citrate transport system substrate-binding protein
MRIVSMVPSWTETLIAAGAHVVGRTRFCIHPKEKLASIPAVGGTKDWDIELIRSLKPDLILLDKEENTKKMSQEAPAALFVTHIQCVEDVSKSLLELSQKLNLLYLKDIAERWRSVELRPIKERQILDMPGVIEWIQKPEHGPEKFLYIIWRKPWMAVSQNTFIGSQFHHLGLSRFMMSKDKKYFEFEMNEIEPSTLLLFSSEPFPFAQKKAELRALKKSSLIMNGEGLSWFGIRALEFLAKNK